MIDSASGAGFRSTSGYTALSRASYGMTQRCVAIREIRGPWDRLLGPHRGIFPAADRCKLMVSGLPLCVGSVRKWNPTM